jgi:hypothetical protein
LKVASANPEREGPETRLRGLIERRMTMETVKKALGTAIGLVFVFAVASLFTRNDSQAAKRAPSAAPARGYYLTSTIFVDGAHALTACAAGYHMASLWEIHEPSNLRYDQDPAGDGTNLGHVELDSGQGPPATRQGWIRGGIPSPYWNCAAWTTNSSLVQGAVADLAGSWDSPGVTASPWEYTRMTCDQTVPVWCVQD